MSIASTAQARAAKRSRFIHKRTFLVATRKLVARRGETRPITANRRHPENRTAKTKAPGPRPAPGRRIVAGCRARIGGTARQPAGNGEAEPAAAFPFCSAERSPRPAGIVASMSEPVRASFDATRRPWVERGHRREPALRQGALLCLLSLSPQERRSPAGARPGQQAPTEGNPRTEQQGSRAWTPACAGATNRLRMPRPKRRRQTLGDDANFGSARCRQWRSRAGKVLCGAPLRRIPARPRARRQTSLARRCVSPRRCAAHPRPGRRLD